MKSKLLYLSVAAVCLAASILFLACPKTPTLAVDPVAAILKDLDSTTYRITFTNNTDRKLIAKDSYGSLSDLTMVSLKDYGAFGLDELRVPLGAVPLIPKNKLVWPTCVDWVPLIDIAQKFKEVAINSKLAFANDINILKTDNGALLATSDVVSAVRSIKRDKMDLEGLKGVDLNKVLIIFPDQMSNGIDRPAYGNADLTANFANAANGAAERQIGTLRLRRSIKDLFPPKYWGCFDIKYLINVRDNLVRLDQNSLFKNSKIQDMGGGIAQASF